MDPLASLLAPYRRAIAGQDMSPDDPLMALLQPQQTRGGGGGSGASMGNLDLTALQQKAAQMAQQYGWGPGQIQALVELWTRESGWNPQADNPTSSAFGIPQAMTSIHDLPKDYMTDPLAQIDWGLSYVNQRYGSPKKALKFHDANNYY